MDEQLKRIAYFLSQYVHCNGGPIPWDDVEVIKDAVSIVLEDEVMTVDEMRREALKEYDVIIPWNFFPEEE